MSGLEKFEATDAWKNKFKKLLFMERKTVLHSTDVIKETERYSLDICKDIQTIVEEKKLNNPKEKAKICEMESEDKENCGFSKNNPNATSFSKSKFKNQVQFNTGNNHIIENEVIISKNDNISDESFETMEKMCNKTASDPDSTLFHYLNSDNKRDVIEATKKRYSGYSISKDSVEDAEFAAINRLLNDGGMEEQSQLINESPLKSLEITQIDASKEIRIHEQSKLINDIRSKSFELTQIEDIEAPSRLWENTECFESILQTSPVKMIGLLRPSTILECANESDISSIQTSYQSAATKILPNEISSSCYETASDSLTYSKATNIFEMEQETSKIIDLTQDFDKNVEAYNEQIVEEESDESIIELLSDDEIKTPTCAEKYPFIKLETVETSVMKSSFSYQFNENLINFETPLKKLHSENISLNIEETDKKADEVKYTENNSYRSNLEDSPTLDGISDSTDIIKNINESKEGSPQFNDTLEEVEYLMKKGMEIMAGTTPKRSFIKHGNIQSPNVLKEKQNTFMISPVKESAQTSFKEYDDFLRVSPKKTPSSMPNSTKKSCYKSPNRFVLNVKPFPKFDVFKKPTSTCKTVSGRQKDLFPHVISPIGAYMKKTATAPLMSTMKASSNTLHSKAFRELEYESRKYQPKFNIDPDTLGITALPKSPAGRTLPKKAYISSNLRQVNDERSPITIPGGAKIQKYLDPAVLPAVIRHDGKAKLPEINTSKMPVKMQKTTQVNSPALQRQDTKDVSLANLSVMSGDVSVYTIQDAQKF